MQAIFLCSHTQTPSPLSGYLIPATNTRWKKAARASLRLIRWYTVVPSATKSNSSLSSSSQQTKCGLGVSASDSSGKRMNPVRVLSQWTFSSWSKHTCKGTWELLCVTPLSWAASILFCTSWHGDHRCITFRRNSNWIPEFSRMLSRIVFLETHSYWFWRCRSSSKNPGIDSKIPGLEQSMSCNKSWT